METSNMKNIIVLKNLPSNIIDEAIIIFKETQKITEKELIKEKNNISQKSIEKYKSKEMIINEAEMVINGYIKGIEKNKEKKNKNKRINNKLKIYSIAITVLFLISLIINFI